MARPVLHLTIQERRNVDRIAIASPRDFVSTPAAHPVDGVPLPYCIDFRSGRALYAVGAEPHAVQAAPFYYLYLRRHAAGLISVPIEQGALTRSTLSGTPVFMFSPGRCGSTLLSRVLAEAGVTSVSEPDFYTQAAAPFWSSPLNPVRGAVRKAMWSMTDDLTAALGGAPVVKLRAECARAPEIFVRGPGARTLVMFRGFEDWARSTARTFGAPPGKAVRKYHAALTCSARLSLISTCRVLRYEDWVANPAGAASDLAQFLSVTIPDGAIAKATAAHYQEPVPGRPFPRWEAKFDATMRLWRSPRLVSARERLEIPNVWG